MCKVQYTFKVDRQQLICSLRCILQQDTRLSIRCHAVLAQVLEIATLNLKKKNAQHLAPLLRGGNTISWTWHNTLPAHTTPMMYSYEHLLSHPDNPTLVPHNSLFQSQLEISLKATGMDKLHYTREGPAISISELGTARLHAQKMECIVWISHHTAWSLASRRVLIQWPTHCGIQRMTPSSLAEGLHGYAHCCQPFKQKPCFTWASISTSGVLKRLLNVLQQQSFKAQWLLYVPPSLTPTNYELFPSHSTSVRFVWFSDQTVVIPLNSITWLQVKVDRPGRRRPKDDWNCWLEGEGIGQTAME